MASDSGMRKTLTMTAFRTSSCHIPLPIVSTRLQHGMQNLLNIYLFIAFTSLSQLLLVSSEWSNVQFMTFVIRRKAIQNSNVLSTSDKWVLRKWTAIAGHPRTESFHRWFSTSSFH